MRLLRDPGEAGPCVLVLGAFDGIHRGHQVLLMTGGALAEKYGVPLQVCCFDPHPVAVLFPERAPGLLTTLPEKAELMAGFGVDALCVMTFTRAFAGQSPEEYLETVWETFHPRAVVCGFNFTFGDRGRGNEETLRTWGEKNGVEIAVVPEFRLDGETVSSTRVRRLLQKGDIHAATVCLGHSYTLSGPVQGGKHVGHTLGFPTANVSVSARKLLPAYGVYSAWLETEDAVYPCVLNVGTQPTVPSGKVTVEAFVLSGDVELYGKNVRLSLLNYQRPEQRFGSLEELQRQITADAEEATRFFAEME